MNLLCDRFVNVDGVRIHYTELPGPGEDVVLIHGFASSTYTWRELGALLNAQGFHVWALDLKGFGWSEKPRDSGYDPFSLMEDVVEWMQTVGLENAVVAGNSLGGGIASLLALIYPEKVSRLVLINPLVPYNIPLPLLIRAAHLPLAPQLARFFVTREIVYFNLKQVFYDASLVTAEKLEAYYEPLASPGCMRAQTQVARAMDPAPFRKYLATSSCIEAPVLVIWGENDRWIPLKYGHRLMAETDSKGVFVVLPECGHIPQEEKPRDVARCMTDFLTDAPIIQVGDTPYCQVESRL